MKIDIPSLLNDLKGYYSRDMMASGWYKLAMNFYHANPRGNWEDVSAATILSSEKKQPGMVEVTRIGLSVLTNRTVFNDFYNSLPVHISNTIYTTVWEGIISNAEIEKRSGIKVLVPPKTKWGSYSLHTDFEIFRAFLTTKYGESIVDTELYMPFPGRKIIQTYITKPKDYFFNPIDEPTDQALSVFSAENNIINELPAIATFYTQGQYKYSDKGKPSIAGIKKIQKLLQLKEFFGSDSLLRSTLIAGLMFGYEPTATGIPDILRRIFTHNFDRQPAARYLLTMLRGMSFFATGDFDLAISARLRNIFAALPAAQWIDIENLHNYQKYHIIELNPLSANALANKVYYELPANGDYKERKYINNGNIRNLITKPMVSGTAFLFAAFGLLELSYDAAWQTGALGVDMWSDYDSLKAVRLTALGAYVLGISNEYTVTGEAGNNQLIPEENNLIIRTAGNAEMAHIQLMNYAIKISDNRYQFSPAVFLKECKTQKDIVQKIAMFRNSFGGKLSPFWTQQLDMLLANSVKIKQVNGMSVYQIPADSKELHRIIVHDEHIKSLIVRAEQFYILVPQANETLLKNRLKEYGILLQ